MAKKKSKAMPAKAPAKKGKLPAGLAAFLAKKKAGKK